MSKPEILSLKQMAEELGLSPSTLNAQRKNGRLNAVKVGGAWIVTRAEVDRYAQESLGKQGRRRNVIGTQFGEVSRSDYQVVPVVQAGLIHLMLLQPSIWDLRLGRGAWPSEIVTGLNLARTNQMRHHAIIDYGDPEYGPTHVLLEDGSQMELYRLPGSGQESLVVHTSLGSAHDVKQEQLRRMSAHYQEDFFGQDRPALDVTRNPDNTLVIESLEPDFRGSEDGDRAIAGRVVLEGVEAATIIEPWQAPHFDYGATRRFRDHIMTRLDYLVQLTPIRPITITWNDGSTTNL